MAESIIQSGAGNKSVIQEVSSVPGEQSRPGEQHKVGGNNTRSSYRPTPPIIWTPRFILLFTLTLVVGLSMESLLTQGWLNHYYSGSWASLGHVAVIGVCCLAISIITRSSWIRIGSIFGCVCVFFSVFDAIIRLHPFDPTSPILVHLHVGISSALVGAFLCFSLEHTPHNRSDTWFFLSAPLLSISGIVLAFFLVPADDRSFSLLETDVAAAALLLSTGIWWLRPSCWKAQPCPTFLFGLAPAIVLLLSLPNVATDDTSFFMGQVSLLCILLGTIRILQCELRH
jgi:hypothetical protein